MTEPTSARVPGHTLDFEGSAYLQPGCAECEVPHDGPSWLRRDGHGHCSCGAYSDHTQSKGTRKRWHRQHKGDVLASEATAR